MAQVTENPRTSAKTEVATFDCYGTLVDWEGGVGSFLYDLALRNNDPDPPPGVELRERWERIQFEIIQGPYRPYKQVLAESLGALCAERGWDCGAAESEAFVRSMRSWQPFPDTHPALTRAREQGIRLVIISNTDRDIIEHTLRHLRVPFDDVVTAEDCGAYKPSPAVFERALDHVGVPPERILHVAFGFEYDNGPAKRAGMRTAWVNRHVRPQPLGEEPDHTWRDLWGLPEAVGADPVPLR
ncbi:MAG: haloacid dehalogenase type II [Streptosporangiales bacterium]|nr:haloacid dehalogenase type II [Streptosporangiales bacterium]